MSASVSLRVQGWEVKHPRTSGLRKTDFYRRLSPVLRPTSRLLLRGPDPETRDPLRLSIPLPGQYPYTRGQKGTYLPTGTQRWHTIPHPRVSFQAGYSQVRWGLEVVLGLDPTPEALHGRLRSHRPPPQDTYPDPCRLRAHPPPDTYPDPWSQYTPVSDILTAPRNPDPRRTPRVDSWSED